MQQMKHSQQISLQREKGFNKYLQDADKKFSLIMFIFIDFNLLLL